MFPTSFHLSTLGTIPSLVYHRSKVYPDPSLLQFPSLITILPALVSLTFLLAFHVDANPYFPIKEGQMYTLPNSPMILKFHSSSVS